MLLVDDRDRQRGEHHGLLDQGVGADHQLGLAGGERVEQLTAPGGWSRRGEQCCGDARVLRATRFMMGCEQRLQRAEVLFGEGLGGSHQGRLVPGLDRAEHRVDADHGLARTDLPHQQALHRLRLGEVLVDFVDRPPLVASQLEGQRVDPCRGLPAPLRKPDAALAGDATTPSRDEGRLIEKELLEGEPLPGRLGGVLIGREVGGHQRVLSSDQPQLPAQAARHGLDRVAGQWDRLPGPLTDPLRAQPLARSVDRDDPGRVQAGL